MQLRFKAQILTRSKGYLDFKKIKNLQGGILRNLLLHGIFLEFEGKKIFFKWNIQMVDVKKLTW
jgi:hypothetical protein